jgi:hypothetical protein
MKQIRKQTIKLSELRQIIREEVQKLIQSKIPIRLKELTTKGWILSEDEQTIINPVTGRKVRISSALSYASSHPAHIAAVAAQQKQKGQEQGQQQTDMYGNVRTDLPPRPQGYQTPPPAPAQPKKKTPSYTVKRKDPYGFGSLRRRY